MTVVIAPIDGSALALRAVPWAARLAGPGGTVVLVRAIPAERDFVGTIFPVSPAGDSTSLSSGDAWVATASADVDDAANQIEDASIAVERAIAEGNPEEAIVAAVDRFNADAIAMASHGRGTIGRAIFGSVADRVARTSPVPVLILRANDEAADDAVISRVIVPLDGSELAEEALPVAADVAQRFNAPVYVVSAVDPSSTMPASARGLFPAPAATPEVVERIWQGAEDSARDTVANAIARLQEQGVDASGATLSGSPFFAISEIARPDDLLVLTSHGRGGVRRWLLGSVAEKLVREAPAPVMLVPASSRVAQSEA
jgi:nucleotide-binding universal stress UspA family protein